MRRVVSRCSGLRERVIGARRRERDQ